MKKHFKSYVNGFQNAADLRAQLMEAETAGKVEELILAFLKHKQDSPV
jgi:tRNA-dihydrouridine synthase